MSSTSQRLSLPFIQAAQAQKHVTHNEGMRLLDDVVHLSVLSQTFTSPPSQAVAGDRYIVGDGASNDWQGHDQDVAVFHEANWVFYTPKVGWMAWDQTAEATLIFDGTGWTANSGTSAQQNLDQLGINATADTTNRLSVAADAALFNHDGTDHQVKINKASASDTASLLFQSDFVGHAEMGLAGSNDFEIKTSDDGTTFHTALQIDAATGEVSFPSGISNLGTGTTTTTLGTGDVVAQSYIAAKGTNLVPNGTGLMGTNYNLPPSFVFDGSVTPNLPGAFRFDGYGGGLYQSEEFVGVDPNKIYKITSYIRQASVPGDWSAFNLEDRHRHFAGVTCYDIDKNLVIAANHMRYRTAAGDSLTHLTAPLAPGDTVVEVQDTSGWNTTETASFKRGIIVFGYKNSLGATYDHYSRTFLFAAFDTSGVDQTTHKITLANPWPTNMGNPDDPNGTWPIGTRLANTNNGAAYKYSLLHNAALPTTDQWYQSTNTIGGIDISGTNNAFNFPPGTAYVKLFWQPNYTNRAGGLSGYPDTGADHSIWFTGLSVTEHPLAFGSPNSNGSVDIQVGGFDAAQSDLAFSTPQRTLEPI
ncbi:MAG: DUF2793 domain-containing protein [Pseudomonadota bacterium]